MNTVHHVPGADAVTSYAVNAKGTNLHFDMNDYQGENKDGGFCSVQAFLDDGVTGGELVIPKYRIAFALGDGDIFFKQGWKQLHGNAPVKAPIGKHRYSIVGYANKKICNKRDFY